MFLGCLAPEKPSRSQNYLQYALVRSYLRNPWVNCTYFSKMFKFQHCLKIDQSPKTVNFSGSNLKNPQKIQISYDIPPIQLLIRWCVQVKALPPTKMTLKCFGHVLSKKDMSKPPIPRISYYSARNSTHHISSRYPCNPWKRESS